MTEIDNNKAHVNMGATVPEPIRGTEFLCDLARVIQQRTWVRQFFYTGEGKVLVYDYTMHDLMPDCRVGFVDGPYTLAETHHRHPEFSAALRENWRAELREDFREMLLEGA